MSTVPSEAPYIRFLDAMAQKIPGVDGRMMGDPYTEKLLYRLLLWSKKDKITGGSIASERLLAKTLGTYGVSRKVVRVRLRLLARFTIIRVSYSFDPEKVRYTTNIIEIDPNLFPYLMGRRGFPPRDIDKQVLWRVPLGIEREKSQIDLQGFDEESHTYGKPAPGTPERVIPLTSGESEPEPEPKRDYWAEATLLKESAEEDKKAEKKRENFAWKKKCEAFVTGAAICWKHGQKQRYGREEVMPAWHGEAKHLGSVPRKQQRELAKIFENEGGFRSALAWWIFMGTAAKTKPDGSLVFDLAMPHRQWATADKQPAFFAKHFNSITSDPAYKKYVSDPAVRDLLVIAFTDEVISSGPRYQKANPVLEPPKSFVTAGEKP